MVCDRSPPFNTLHFWFLRFRYWSGSKRGGRRFVRVTTMPAGAVVRLVCVPFADWKMLPDACRAVDDAEQRHSIETRVDCVDDEELCSTECRPAGYRKHTISE